MLMGDAVGFVNTSASCRSLFTHRVLIPVARICCRVAVTSIDVRFLISLVLMTHSFQVRRIGFYSRRLHMTQAVVARFRQVVGDLCLLNVCNQQRIVE